MYRGACAQRNDVEIFICFEDLTDKATFHSCSRAIGPLKNFEKLPNSTFDHGDTRIAATSG